MFAALKAVGAFVVNYWEKTKEQRPTVQEAIHALHLAQDDLYEKRQLLIIEIDIAAENIRKNVLVNEQAALVALKQKKRLENQLHKIDGLLSKIGWQKQQLEDANIYKEVVEKMSYASKALEEFHQKLL
ncbi:charged multivesicular body protein 4c-like [Acropora muricata]|uniref:charged multivesicular body protein 4c-like n=1 Tax=Acropora muricata TaxID=159855 RepID=UPI0034E5AF0B